MIRTYITCDLCNPGDLPVRQSTGRGFAFMSRHDALAYGWKSVRNGCGWELHLCLSDCGQCL